LQPLCVNAGGLGNLRRPQASQPGHGAPPEGARIGVKTSRVSLAVTSTLRIPPGSGLPDLLRTVGGASDLLRSWNMRELAPWRSLSGASQAAGSETRLDPRPDESGVPLGPAGTSACTTFWVIDLPRQVSDCAMTSGGRCLVEASPISDIQQLEYRAHLADDPDGRRQRLEVLATRRRTPGCQGGVTLRGWRFRFIGRWGAG